MTRSIITGILICFCSLNAFPQTIISGVVRQENGETLPGVNAYLEGTYDGGTSNEKGVFRFETTKTGPRVLRVEFMGYEPFTQTIDLNGDTIKVHIKLKEAFNVLNAVTITAGTFEAGDKRQAVTISPLDMLTTAGAAGDVFGALQSLPGTVTNGESGRLFVKGGDSEESQTYIDGALVFVPYQSSAPNLSTRGRFNPFMFKGTVFSTGGYSAEYGQALSSVLLLNTKDMPEEDQLDLSFLSAGAGIAGTKCWGSGALTATLDYKNLSPYMNLIKQNYKWIDAPRSGQGALSFRQKTGKNGILKLYSTFEQRDFTIQQTNLDEGTDINYHLKNNNHFTDVSWNTRITEKLGMNIATSFTWDRDSILYGQNTVKEKTTGIFLKNVLALSLTDKIMLKLGGAWQSKRFRQTAELPEEDHDNRFTSNNWSVFSEARLYASSKFVTRIGGRAEYAAYLDNLKFSPRLSTAYKISDKTQLSAAYGWFFQEPVRDYLLYSKKLKQERADHYTLTFLSSLEKRTIRAELYYKKYSDLAKLDGEFYLPESYNNNGYGYAKGIDLFWRDKQTIPGGDYWISYSFLDTKRNYRDYPVKAVPTFASRHNLSVVYKQWFGGLRSLLGINAQYASPRVYNNPNSPVFNREKMPPYRTIDISWSFLYRQNIILYGAVTNVPGFKNKYGRRYSNTPGTDGTYSSATVLPGSSRFFVLACFITLSRKGDANQLDKIK